jgi:hypothetical protein
MAALIAHAHRLMVCSSLLPLHVEMCNTIHLVWLDVQVRVSCECERPLDSSGNAPTSVLAHVNLVPLGIISTCPTLQEVTDAHKVSVRSVPSM